MKRALLICLCFLFFCGCASSGKYEEGYAAGYDAGYKAALEMRAMPDITPAPTARAMVTPNPSAATSEDFTVYVSRNGVIHKKSNCSGMIYYHEMLYSETKGIYEKKCSKCFK